MVLLLLLILTTSVLLLLCPQGMPLASPEAVVPGDLMLYDEKRKIQAMVTDPAAKSVLVPIIRAKGYLGAKGYFWAVQEEQDQIRVFTDEWPKQQHNW